MERSLQLFDLAGIAHFSADTSGLPKEAEAVTRCYTPLFWDKLTQCLGSVDSLPESLTKQWIEAIATHPVAYAEHRLAHFNRTTFFMVPPMQQCVDAPEFHQCDSTKWGLFVDFVAKNALLWPATWLAVSLVLLFQKIDPFSRALNLSGLLFGGAYLVVGVAADFRYFYWTELAVQAAIVFHLGRTGRLQEWKPIAAVVAAVWAVGYTARLVML